MDDVDDPGLVNKAVNITLVTLMGLPGSGKTTLCEEILYKSNFSSDTKLLKITFDEFIPLDIQSTFTIQESNSASTISIAKILRKNFIKTIAYFIAKLKQSDSWNFTELLQELSLDADSVLPAASFPSKLMALTENVNLDSYDNVILLIDDNNYYKSMRNEFYQIAKSHKVGFCVLYPNASLSVCQERNRLRAAPVPASVIEEMKEKLEEPNPIQNLFDMLCICIADVQDSSTLALIQTTLEYSLKNPIDVDPPPDRSLEIANQRRICQDNEIHQADLVLRKWIHTELNLASFRMKGGEKRKFSEELLLKKTVVLCKLKSGELKISSSVEDEIGFRKEIVALARNIQLPSVNP